ncbi:hypothetical protein, partial [Synechocystis salina]|uniref:hypothetical protein n=1 Tax=Synechocystis salina TaxID=945780 RepID=UPI001D13B5FD
MYALTLSAKRDNGIEARELASAWADPDGELICTSNLSEFESASYCLYVIEWHGTRGKTRGICSFRKSQNPCFIDEWVGETEDTDVGIVA